VRAAEDAIGLRDAFYDTVRSVIARQVMRETNVRLYMREKLRRYELEAKYFVDKLVYTRLFLIDHIVREHPRAFLVLLGSGNLHLA